MAEEIKAAEEAPSPSLALGEKNTASPLLVHGEKKTESAQPTAHNERKTEKDSEETKEKNKTSRYKCMDILILLAVFTLILSSVNSYYIFNIGSRINSLIIENPAAAGGIRESQPLNNPPQPSQPPSRIEASIDDDPVKGNKDAPVAIIEFSDFECPFCTRFYEQTLPSIEENYIKTGKVKLVYRDFPLSFHQNAQKAAEAAECADEQGRFWEIHDKIFENGVSGGVNQLKQYAKDTGLNTAQFNECLDSGKMASEVQKDFNDGQGYGVSGTPAFFINGIEVVGAQPFSVFQQIIEQELNG